MAKAPVRLIMNIETHDVLIELCTVIVTIARRGRDGETCSMCNKVHKGEKHDRDCPVRKAMLILDGKRTDNYEVI